MNRKITLMAGSLALASFGGPALVQAAVEEWKDTQGASFRGEPVESLGPLALFQTKGGGGRPLAWRFLAPADIARFYEQTKGRAARADDWSQARSLISEEIAGRVSRVRDGKLVPAETKGAPEPEFYVLFYASAGASKSWDMVGHSADPMNRLKELYPGMVEGLFFGLRHKGFEQTNMVVSMNFPGLVAVFSEQGKLNRIWELAPKEDDTYGVVVVTRDGVPLFFAQNPDDAPLAKLFADLTGLLELMRPGNPRGWQDRAFYLRAVQPVAFANGYAEPVLVGNPLVPEGLKKNGVARVDAQIDVGADGHVTNVTLNPEAAVPPKMAGPLAEALKKACVFVPAVDHGQFVAGHFHYYLEVPR